MFDELPLTYRKRMKIIAFVVMPILIIVATFFFVAYAYYLDALGELRYILFIILSQLFVYFSCCHGAYKKLKKESELDKENHGITSPHARAQKKIRAPVRRAV